MQDGRVRGVGGLGGEGTEIAPTLDNVLEMWKFGTMWPFGRRKLDPDLIELHKLLEQERRHNKVWRDEIEMEWNDMFDRFKRLYAKIAKRAKEAESVAIGDPEDTEAGLLGDRPGNGNAGGPSIVLQRRGSLRGF